MLVHKLGKARQVALQKCRVAPPAKVLDVMQIVDYRPVLGLRPVVLVLQDSRSRPRIAGEEQTQSVLEVVEYLLAKGGGSYRNAIVFVEFETGDAAIGGDELILLADGFAKQLDLNVAGLLGKGMRADDVALAGVQSAKQCGRKTARRTKAGPGRDVRHAGDLDAVVRADELDGGADDRMSN